MDFIWLIPLLPAAGAALNGVIGVRAFGRTTAGAIACATMAAALGLSVWAFAGLLTLPPASRAYEVVLATWIPSIPLQTSTGIGAFSVEWAFRLDPLSGLMILVVTGIGLLIHIYATAYMKDEPRGGYARFFCYLNLFCFFMLLLVLGSSFIVMFVGWEGVGLCSYLLIGYWYERKSAADAGRKAFITNRIGDWAFLLGIFLVFVTFGTLDFRAVGDAAAGMSQETGQFGVLSAICLLLFIGATGKSAQIPLHVWLPDAMEGPTPVSALIHAATMVTAGVYMVARNAVLFSQAPLVMLTIAITGALTALMAATIGLVQNDIKRVLAYSTVSQLGYMFVAMGVGAYAAGIFHLYTHAFFKALLFLGSGAVIHALAGEQDLRRMGGLKDQLPITYWTFLIGALAIAGVPGLSGFFSKDEILYRTFASGHVRLWTVGLITSLLTAIYMFRLVFLAFHGLSRAASAAQPGGDVHGAPEHPAPTAQALHPAPAAQPPAPPAAAQGSHGGHIHDAPPPMAIPLLVLAIGSVVAGYVGFPAVLGGSNWFEHFLEPSFGVQAAEETAEHGPELLLMLVSTAVAVAGIGIAVYFFLKNRAAADRLAERAAGMHRVLEHKYYVDEIYDAAIVQPILIVSEQGLWKGVDVRVIDGAVNGVGETVAGSGELLRRLQTGSVRAYAASLLLGVVFILGYYLWR
jgi:NADH-quinone oxidoreductase subunit L